jgi:hypothetical protein
MATHCAAHADKSLMENVVDKKCIVCKKTTANYGPKGGASTTATHCEKHANKLEMENVTKKTCKEKGCRTTPSYGSKGGLTEYCEKHAKENMYNVISKRCAYPNCDTIPCYGPKGGTCGSRLFCEPHADKKYYENVVLKRCMDCKTTASHGPIGGLRGSATHCSQHSDDTMENVVSKRCAEDGCKTLPCFGLIGDPPSCATHCKEHADETMEDVKNKRCRDCPTRASFGKIGGLSGDVSHCVVHKDDTMEDLLSKKCKAPNCRIGACYGLKGTKTLLYCASHSDKETMENIFCKRCDIEDCMTVPCYGAIGSPATRCLLHADHTFMVSVGKRCDFEDCETHPCFGYIGGNATEAFRCADHADLEIMEDLVHKRCDALDCKLRAGFPNALGVPLSFCFLHASQDGVHVGGWKDASKIACKCFDRIQKTLGVSLQHKHSCLREGLSGSEFKIPGTNLDVDAFDTESQTCYEFLGNVWHGYPIDHPMHMQTGPKRRHPVTQVFLTNADMFQETMERLKVIQSKGYRVRYIWEHEFTKLANKPDLNVMDCVHDL